MSKSRIYTIGGTDMGWRRQLESKFTCCDGISFIHPPLHINGLTSKEFRMWKKYAIYKSDIAVLNLDYITDDSFFDVGVIDSINLFSKDKKILLFTTGDDSYVIPSFIRDITFHHAPSFEDLADCIQYTLIK